MNFAYYAYQAYKCRRQISRMTRVDDMNDKMSGKGDCNGRILQRADIRFSRQRPVTMTIRRRIYA